MLIVITTASVAAGDVIVGCGDSDDVMPLRAHTDTQTDRQTDSRWTHNLRRSLTWRQTDLDFDFLEADGFRVWRGNLDGPRVAGDLLDGAHEHVGNDSNAQETPDSNNNVQPFHDHIRLLSTVAVRCITSALTRLTYWLHRFPDYN